MINRKFAVIFDGRLVESGQLFAVKQRLKELFKTDQARIETLFSGRPVALKRGLSEEQANKYQAVLKQSGIFVTIETDETESAVANTQVSDQFSLAPLGAELIDQGESKRQSTPANLFHTEHLSLLPQEGNLLKSDEREQSPSVSVDDAYLEWDLDLDGGEILKQQERAVMPTADIDTSSLSFAEEGLQAPSDKKQGQENEVTSKINTDHLSLLPNSPA